MSLIQCTNDCKFQKDGYCGLEKAGVSAFSDPEFKAGCLYYQPIKPLCESLQQSRDVH